jgi:hypothetical protein
LFIKIYYSNLRASIGLSLAALRAGKIQKTSQINNENQKLIIIVLLDITEII